MLCQFTLTMTDKRLLDVRIIDYNRDALVNKVHSEVRTHGTFTSATLKSNRYNDFVLHCLKVVKLLIIKDITITSGSLISSFQPPDADASPIPSSFTSRRQRNRKHYEGAACPPDE